MLGCEPSLRWEQGCGVLRIAVLKDHWLLIVRDGQSQTGEDVAGVPTGEQSAVDWVRGYTQGELCTSLGLPLRVCHFGRESLSSAQPWREPFCALMGRGGGNSG